MWRKEQHFVETPTGLDSTHLSDDYCTNGFWCGKRPSTPEHTDPLTDCCGRTIYKGREFDIFGSVIVTQINESNWCQCNNDSPSMDHTTADTSLTPHPSASKGNKRKALESFDMHDRNKQCRTTTFYGPDVNMNDSLALQTSTIDIIHTIVSAPVDLLKPMNDNNDCFSTQHAIYS